MGSRLILLVLGLQFSLTVKAISSPSNFEERPNTGEPFNNQDLLSLECHKQKQCGLCHGIPGCVWCSDPKYIQGSYTRCNTLKGHNRDGCTQFESKGHATASSNEKPRESGGSIVPNEYDVSLWVGQRINITFQYKDAGNKPLDLYYLMDLSKTMADDKKAVEELGRVFASELKSTTTNLRMGFGSFVDKPVMPFAAYSHIHSPESGLLPVYGFINQLKLTQVDPRYPTFERAVQAAQISVNLDAPEGGLDAMMQALECWDEIGWRVNAHRIMVVSTDGMFHIAGDGKLGGIVVPNDGMCHMENHTYIGTKIYDYPSVAQIVAKIREKQIYVLFAVTNEVEKQYRALSERVSEYARTIPLDSKSRSVGEYVRRQYKEIRSTVEVTSTPQLKESELGITFYVKCDSRNDFVNENKCTKLEPNAVVQFIAEFELKRCPSEYSDKEWTQILHLSPTGSQESLDVTLRLKCGCGCEGNRAQAGDNPACTGRGSIECGICRCNEGFTGDQCQCQKDSESDEGTRCLKPCIERRGTCKCGKCACNAPWSGPTCECDSTKCPCGVESHGRCECEECICEPTWRTVAGRQACSCSTAKDGCLKRKSKGTESDEECNGDQKGSCVCNRCQCRDGWLGKYCDVCQNCKCLDDFVQCSVVRENKTHVRLTDGEEIGGLSNCTQVMATDVTILQLSSNLTLDDYYESGTGGSDVGGGARGGNKELTRCRSDVDGCSLEYIFGYNEAKQRIEVRIQSLLECPPPSKPPNPLPIILVTVTSVVVLGILTLLLWKILTYMVDRHEFNKFEKECQDRKWETGGNPLYKEATSTFQNPAYTD